MLFYYRSFGLFLIQVALFGCFSAMVGYTLARGVGVFWIDPLYHAGGLALVIVATVLLLVVLPLFVIVQLRDAMRDAAAIVRQRQSADHREEEVQGNAL